MPLILFKSIVFAALCLGTLILPFSAVADAMKAAQFDRGITAFECSVLLTNTGEPDLNEEHRLLEHGRRNVNAFLEAVYRGDAMALDLSGQYLFHSLHIDTAVMLQQPVDFISGGIYQKTTEGVYEQILYGGLPKHQLDLGQSRNYEERKSEAIRLYSEKNCEMIG